MTPSMYDCSAKPGSPGDASWITSICGYFSFFCRRRRVILLCGKMLIGFFRGVKDENRQGVSCQGLLNYGIQILFFVGGEDKDSRMLADGRDRILEEFIATEKKDRLSLSILVWRHLRPFLQRRTTRRRI